MELHEAIDNIYDIAEELINSMEQIKATKAGLDLRAGYRLWISEDAIAVAKHADNSLQYYGGFEYVDKEYRQEMGEYVFYLADDDRVRGHIERWEENDD